MKTSQYSLTNIFRSGIPALFTFAILSSSSALLAQDIELRTQTSASTSSLSFPGVSTNGFDGSNKTPVVVGESTSVGVSALPDEPSPNTIFSDARGAAAIVPDPNPYNSDGRNHRDADPSPRVAPVYNRYIEPFETAQRLTMTQSLIFGLHQSISPYFLLSIVSAAGYEQARNSAPNYGTNIGSYGERLGAAAIRDTSQSVFSDSVMAPLLHQDPRYYIMGDRHNVFERGAYAASRVVVTRSSDDGRLMPNYSLVAGYAEAAALTNAYYPDVNVGFEQTAKSLGGSLLGLAVSNVVREFLPDLLRVTHLERFE